MSQFKALVLGATGLCGSGFLKHAEASRKLKNVYTITRRDIPDDKTAIQIIDKDTSNWASKYPTEKIDIVLTGLATTRRSAGGFDKQYKIDHDLNLELAKKAKENGCSVYVVVSSAGANENSWMSYLRMKGDIERDLESLNFDHLIILRPGALLGERTSVHKGIGNGPFVMLGNWVYRSKLQMALGYPVYGDEVGEVGVYLALKALEAGSKSTEKIQVISSADILRISDKIKEDTK